VTAETVGTAKCEQFVADDRRQNGL